MSELSGYGKSDLNRLKDLQAAVSYTYDEKFEGSDTVPCRYIMLADANNDVGILRDETGDRRNLIVYVNQLPDKDGKRDWVKEGSRAAYLSDVNSGKFEADFWQIMAECKNWFESNSQNDWTDFVKVFSDGVLARSKEFMNSGNATIRDVALDLNMIRCILRSPMRTGHTKPRKDSGEVVRHFVQIDAGDLVAELEKRTKGGASNFDRLVRRMEAAGATYGKFAGNVRAFRFMDVENVIALSDKLHGIERDEDGNVLDEAELSDVIMPFGD